MGIIRLLLAIAVVIAHTGEPLFGIKMTDGPVAVECFFIISGFYMTMILSEKYIGFGKYILFITNRFLRIYPMYWAALFLYIGASWISYTYVSGGGPLFLGSFLFFFSKLQLWAKIYAILMNLGLYGLDTSLFFIFLKDGSLEYSARSFGTGRSFNAFAIIQPAWTLGLELGYYALAPFISLRSTKTIIGIICASLLLRSFIYFGLGLFDIPWTYCFLPNELSLFLMGTFAYKMYIIIKDLPIQKFSLLALVLLILSILFFDRLPGPEGVRRWFLYFQVAGTIAFAFQLTKSSRLDSRIGELSYPIYLMHTLITALAALLHFPKQSFWYSSFIVLATIFTSYIMVILISDPIERFRQARLRG